MADGWIDDAVEWFAVRLYFYAFHDRFVFFFFKSVGVISFISASGQNPMK
jgi:hypothetical protein